MNEFNKQREYLINKLRTFLEMDVSDNELCAMLSKYRYLNYYFSDQDEYKSLLLQRKLLNRYARYHEIRYDDSVDIINKYLNSIVPLNDEIKFMREQYAKQPPNNLESSKSKKGSKVTQAPSQLEIEEYVPLFI
jgi:hypothetical protein